MSGINMTRVVLGGLVAGVVLNVGETIFNGVLFGEATDAAVKALNLPPMTGATIVWFIISAFIFSIAMIWLYAAIRPRLGAGPKNCDLCRAYRLDLWVSFPFNWLSGYGALSPQLVDLRPGLECFRSQYCCGGRCLFLPRGINNHTPHSVGVFIDLAREDSRSLRRSEMFIDPGAMTLRIS